MKILVTGCNGQLGREIINQLESKKTKGEPIELLKCDKESLDISNFEDVYTYILEKKRRLLSLCGFYKC